MSVADCRHRLKAWLGMAFAVLGLVLASPLMAQSEPAALNAPRVAVLAADLGPMARIDLTWPNKFRYSWSQSGRVLLLDFDQPFNAPDLGALRQRLGGWIAGIDKSAAGLRLTAAQNVYFNVIAVGPTVSVEMTYAPSTVLGARQQPAATPVRRPILTRPAPKAVAVPPQPPARPVTEDKTRREDVEASDREAQEAIKRLRRGSLETPVVTLAYSTRTAMSAQQLAPPQLKAQVGDDVAVLVIDWASLVVVTPQTGAGEVLLKVDQPVDPRLVQGLAEQLPEWLQSVIAGYDTLLFVGADGVDVNFQHAGRTSTIRLTRTALPVGSASKGTVNAEDMRLEILRARLKARQGKTDAARDKLATLQNKDPDNTDVLVELASIEESVGSWRRASGLYEQAISLDPDRRDAAAAQRALDREFGEFIRVDSDYLKVHGGEDQVVTVLSGRFLPTDSLDVGFNAENRYLNDDDILRANGVNEAVSINRQRGEIYVGGSPASGHRIEGAVLGSQGGPGAALRYSYQTPDTFTSVNLTYNRAYWELVEGIADDATQDRIALRHENQFSENWNGEAEIGYNRYDIANIDNAATSYDLTASINYRLPWQFSDVSVGYSFDGQYVGSQATRIDANGNAFNPLPIADSEIHSLNVSLNGVFWEDWRYNLFSSIGFDRFGGFGPSIGGEVIHEVWDDWSYGLRGGHSRVSNRGDGSAFSRLGGFIQVRF